MRISHLFLLTLLILVICIPPAQSNPRSRIIALTADPNDKKNFESESCEIIHELIDATVLDCPDEHSRKHISSRKAIRDEKLSIVDSESNAQIHADSVWGLGYTGRGVTVAVLDTGVDYNHVGLSGSTCGDTLMPNVCGKSFVLYTNSIYDDNGHGTHVSGIITSDGAARSKGVAPDARVWMGKVCDNLGACYTGDIAAGIEYVALNGIAKILSISLGGGGTPSSNCDTDFLANKINWAVLNYGITAVIAAGNTGSIVSSPACASKAIAVGAVARNDTRPSWSGSGNALDITSPGVDIYSTWPGDGYAYLSGTSMATPQVSATIALLKQKNSDLADSEIKDALYKTAKDLGSAGWDRYYGWGRVDALAAVNSVPWPGSFDFSIGVNPVGASVTQGGSIKVNVTITLLSGSSQLVSLSGSISPATTKISGGLSPTTGYPTYTSVGSISTFTDTPPGTYTITITGNGGALTRSTTFTLTVIAASRPSLAVSVTTDKANYTYGSTVYLTIKVTDSSTGNGVAGAALKVTLTGPNGVIGSGTGTTDPNGFLYANFKISSNFPAGTYTLNAEASASGYDPGSGSTTFQVS